MSWAADVPCLRENRSENAVLLGKNERQKHSENEIVARRMILK